MACKATVDVYGPEVYELYPALAPKNNATVLMKLQQFAPYVKPGDDRTPLAQAAYQMMALVTSFFLSLIGGVIAGTNYWAATISKKKNPKLVFATRHWGVTRP